MPIPFTISVRLVKRVCVAATACVGLGAWDDDSDRVEFVTRGAGDAVEVNKATQTIDPWPPYVKNRKLNFNGKRAEIAMQRYQNNRVLQPHPLSPIKAPELPLADPTASPGPLPQPQQ